MKTVLVLSEMSLPRPGSLTPGSGARPYEMARALGRAGLQVTLLGPETPQAIRGIECRRNEGGELPEGFDAYVLPTVFFRERARRPRGLVVVDSYDPLLLSYGFRDPDTFEGRLQFQRRIHTLARALTEGDVFLHAGEHGRNYLLGMLCLLGRLGPGHPDPGHDLLNVPLGAPPLSEAAGPPLELDPPLPVGAETILWPSGTYVFLDSVRALEAFERVAENRPQVHLLIAGGLGPYPTPADLVSYEKLQSRVEASKYRSRVRFVAWLPYDRRASVYAISKLALVLSHPGPEDTLSWRNRVVDALWGGLPIVVDGGSSLSQIVQEEGAGVITDRTVEGCAKAIENILSSPIRQAAFADRARRLAAGRLSWESCVSTLVDRIKAHTPAHQAHGLSRAPHSPLKLSPRYWGTPGHRLMLSLRMRGPLGFGRHLAQRLFFGRAENRDS